MTSPGEKETPTVPIINRAEWRTPLWLEDGAEVWVQYARVGATVRYARAVVEKAFGDGACVRAGVWEEARILPLDALIVPVNSPYARVGGA